MCWLCEEGLSTEERKGKIADIIDTCERIKSGYLKIERGFIKPHTEAMTKLCMEEKHLCRLILEDALS